MVHRAFEDFSVMLGGSGVDAELRRAGLEDQPAFVGVDEGPVEHVTEEGSGRLGVIGVDERVNTSDHAPSLRRPSHSKAGRAAGGGSRPARSQAAPVATSGTPTRMAARLATGTWTRSPSWLL